MTTAVFTHPDFGAHEVPEGHAERPGRYDAVTRAIGSADLSDVTEHEAPRAAREAILRAHSAVHVDRVGASAPSADLVALDPDTYMGPHSLDAAYRGAGGAIAAVDAVFAGEVHNAFVAARPPGHHAVIGRAMGFCLFNNAVIAALHARAGHGAQRIAVVDFDVHHGNGSQDILEADEDAFFASSHEWPQYPGTGRAEERGVAGNCHNAPLDSGEGSLAFRRAWGDRLLPALRDFGPDVVVISAGFDAHAADPLGGLALTEEDYGWVTEEIATIAAECCAGRIVSVLEGGYDLAALEASARVHLSRLASGDGQR